MDGGYEYEYEYNLTLDNNTKPWPELCQGTRCTYWDRLVYWLDGVLTIIVACLGLLGNLMTMIVLCQKAMRSCINCYLLALAMWDTVVVVCSLLLVGLSAHSELYNQHVYPYAVALVYPLSLTAQTATVWLTVAFTTARYTSVYRPLESLGLCTVHRARKVILAVSVCSVLYNIPRWFEFSPNILVYSVLDLGENSTQFIVRNRTRLIVALAKLGQNHLYLQVYSWLCALLMCIVPLLIVSVLNTRLILAVRRSTRRHRDIRRLRENNVTIMLAAVVFVFTVCQVPPAVYNVAFALLGSDYVIKAFGFRVLSEMMNFLVAFNSAVNFVLYCALGQKFRRAFVHTFCWRCEKTESIHTNRARVPPSRMYRMYRMRSRTAGDGRPFLGRSVNTTPRAYLCSQRGSHPWNARILTQGRGSPRWNDLVVVSTSDRKNRGIEETAL